VNILFASSEIFPFAKTGGLADVADSLPKSLGEFENITKVMPLYGFMKKDNLNLEFKDKIILGDISYKLSFHKKVEDNTATYFVDAPLLSDTQNLYGDRYGDYANNDLRFGIFCKAIVLLAQKLNVDLLHLNDWHTALSALYIKDEMLKIKTVFTIHNLAYQGIFEQSSLEKLSINQKYFTVDGLEFYGNINFLKAGIAYSDAITTVSPTYAKEILTKEFGCGLDGFLKYHKNKLSGILNGINTTIFNPKNDENLYFQYDFRRLENKLKNKKAFLKNSTLKDLKIPLFVMVTRLVEQKGINLILNSLEELLTKEVNLLILGEGNLEFTKELKKMAKEHRNFEFIDAYDEVLSHKTYAAADFLLMPSKFEPCGLNQMIAMRYGAIPIVHGVGGLKDSVADGVSGLVFKKETKKELLLTIDKALKLKKNSKKFNKIRKSNMQKDLSFIKSALKYIEIYKKILL